MASNGVFSTFELRVVSDITETDTLLLSSLHLPDGGYL